MSSSNVVLTELFQNLPTSSAASAPPSVGQSGEAVSAPYLWGSLFGQSIVKGDSLWELFKAYSHVPLYIWAQWVFAHSVRIVCIWTLMSAGLWVYRRTPKAFVDLVAELYASTFVYSLVVFGLFYFPVFTVSIFAMALTVWVVAKLWPGMDKIREAVTAKPRAEALPK
ncbi:hypothetical protein O1611_g9523 [Lasiodiplodia mahajangana]|uniref:Uncharacterized protein n=1 Tax=Lasiodiplodia mahajangana TaxID=1108764 RepID=A0ACC2J8S7_9PEZI|nr:hypothetical protein O1611_g9523 [Lasiodiplodia mahajangana]